MLVVVEESLAGEGSELLAAVEDAGGTARLELWTGDRPMSKAPQAVLDAAETTDLSFFLAEKPLPDEGGARFSLLQTVAGHGGRQIFLGFVDGELLRGELSRPGPTSSGRRATCSRSSRARRRSTSADARAPT